ncbi:MAG: flagellar basal body P-ring formation protein FlgA [Deltaproteobacteria bacterium]|nr:flagellar basal body P-ring formation protein FlgA [Deltaproteobacteria bacterium]
MGNNKVSTIIRLTMIWVIMTLLMPVTAWGAEIQARINSEVEVENDQLVFGDLAEIAGPDSDLKTDLGKVFLGTAPKPGQKLTWRRDYIEKRLKSADFPMDQLDLDLPDTVMVVRAGQKIDNDWFRHIFEEFLSKNEPYKSSSWNLVSVRAGTLPVLPKGQLDYHATSQYSSTPGRLTLNIVLLVDDREVAKIRATAEVEMSFPAVVATRRMEKGDRIQPNDVQIAQVNQVQLHSGALTDLNQAVGQACRSQLLPGQPITAKDLTKADIINRGDRVTIVAQTGSLKISTIGQAKQAGAVGENIQILNISSNKTVMAKVVGAGLVEVRF